MFEPEVFLKQMYYIEESTYDIVATFRRPGIRAPLPPLSAHATACHHCNMSRSQH